MTVKLLFPPIVEPSLIWVADVGKIRLGIHLRDGWCINKQGSILILTKPDDMINILPLLEADRARFFEHVVRVSSMQDTNPGMLPPFPEALLLRAAFEFSVSDYWPFKALEWLGNKPNITPELHASLYELLNQRWATQKIKHRVKRLIRHELQYNQGTC